MMKKSTHKRLTAWLLTLIMAVSLLPGLGMTALAAYPNDVRVYNANKKLISLGDGECLTANDATEATGYTSGTYVARYDSGTLYLKDYHGVAADGQIYAHGDLNIVVENDSSFTTSVSATNNLYGIQTGGKLNISGSGKLTVTANGDGDVYGIYANEGVTISAPLNVQVGKVDSSKNGPVYGIYTRSGAISLSGADKTITATGGAEFACGVYNDAKTSSTAADNGNINISGKLTVNLNSGSSNVGIYTGSGGTITLNGATVNIPSNFASGIYNYNGDVVIKNRSDVTLTSAISNGNGVYARYGGDLIIKNSTVKVSTNGYTADVSKGMLSIKDSIVDLTLEDTFYRVVATANSATNTIDLSGSGSVTLTASGNQTSAMIGGKVTATSGTKLEKGTYYPGLETYDGEYDGSSKTVLQFVHESTAPTADISLSETGTVDFGSVKAGYTTAPTAETVTITNSGTADTGALTIALEGTHATSFTLSTNNIANVAANGNATFTVQPNTGLTAGTYKATVKVSGTGVTEQSFDVKFTVNYVEPRPEISVSHWPDPTVFDSVEVGYDSATGRILTIDNKGTADTGELTITVEGNNPKAFTVSPSKISNIAAGKSAMSTVRPAKGLPAGTYTATLKISGDNVNTLKRNVKFTVKDPNASASVSGKVTSYGSDSDDVTVQLIEAGHTEPAYEAIVTGNSATYSFPTVPAGTYTLKVMKKGHVTREYAVTVVSAPVVQDIKIYMLGDINEDGSINIQDVIRLLNHVNNSNTISNTKHCDINKDGAVNIQDVIRLLNHVNNNQPLF